MGAAAPSPASSRQVQADTSGSLGQALAPSSTAVAPVPRPAAAQIQVQAPPTRAAPPLPAPAPAPVSKGAPAVAAAPLPSSPQLTAAVKPSAPATPEPQPALPATRMSVTVAAPVILAAAAPAAHVAAAAPQSFDLALKPLPQQQPLGHIPTMVLPPAEVRAPAALELGQMQAKQAPLRTSHPAMHDSTTGTAHRHGSSQKASAGSRWLH